jgi:transcriptional regulator with XRE-family HTH domain
MNGQTHTSNSDIVLKIARLVEERGWNQEDFARVAQLNRQTIRQILQPVGTRRLRNVTVSRCAKALGLTVSELRTLPLERLLPRMNNPLPQQGDEAIRQLYEAATQPELLSWIERNPDRARHLTAAEIDELLSLQGTGGPMTPLGVEHFVALLERKRRLIEQVHAIAGTEYLDMLEKLVGLIFDKVQPYNDRR